MNTPVECRSRIEQFLSRKLSLWMGLPDRCSEAAVEEAFTLLRGEGITHLGSEATEYRFRALEAPGFSEPVGFHFRGDSLRLIRTGLWSTDRGGCERLLRALGDPPDRMALAFGTDVIESGSWVYSARGLTLGVIPDTGLIASAAAYQPCTLEAYLRRLHDATPAREFPGPAD